MQIDRRAFMASVGGVAAAELLSPEHRAEAAEHFMMEELGRTAAAQVPPGALQGIGTVFRPRDEPFQPMPDKPTLVDFFKLRFATGPNQHVVRSAAHALQEGHPERTVMACLLHDIVLNLMGPDHGWWGAQLLEPYVDERISWGIRYHQALRFFPDPAVGYEYPEFYNQIFGRDYEPDEYVKEAYRFARNHEWYMEARLITLNDEYGFDPNVPASLEPFIDIIERHFKQPKEGLGFDGSPVAHMWRTMIDPTRPL